MVKRLLFLSIFFLICGCSLPKKIIPSPEATTNDSPRYEGTTNDSPRHEGTITPVLTGSLINRTAFERGGTLGLGLFKPGPGAAADEETDRLSSMLVKGIKETLLEEKTRFSIVEDDQKNSDFYLEGYIEEYAHKGRFFHLSVDGEIWLQETGEKIFLFQTSVLINSKNQNSMAVAYQIGAAIAHAIGKGYRS